GTTPSTTYHTVSRTASTTNTTVGPTPSTPDTTVNSTPSTPGTTISPTPSTPGTTLGLTPSTTDPTVGTTSSTPNTTVSPTPSITGTTVGSLASTTGTTVRSLPSTPGTTVSSTPSTRGTAVSSLPSTPGTTVSSTPSTPGTTVNSTPSIPVGAVFDPFGNQATIPKGGTVTFVLVIVIGETFVPELKNKSSPAFKNMTWRFLKFLIPIYQNRTRFLVIIFISFCPGSVVANIEILYNSTQPIPTVEEVKSPIAEAIGSAPFTIESLQVTKKDESQDGFETWKIGVIACLGLVLLLIICLSVAVIVNGRKAERARYNSKNRRNSFDLDFDLFSSDVDKSNGIPNYPESFEMDERGDIYL
ncbi:Hypothetical predicted protein, partial [Paramuricea clavata]